MSPTWRRVGFLRGMTIHVFLLFAVVSSALGSHNVSLEGSHVQLTLGKPRPAITQDSHYRRLEKVMHGILGHTRNQSLSFLERRQLQRVARQSRKLAAVARASGTDFATSLSDDPVRLPSVVSRHRGRRSGQSSSYRRSPVRGMQDARSSSARPTIRRRYTYQSYNNRRSYRRRWQRPQTEVQKREQKSYLAAEKQISQIRNPDKDTISALTKKAYSIQWWKVQQFLETYSVGVVRTSLWKSFDACGRSLPLSSQDVKQLASALSMPMRSMDCIQGNYKASKNGCRMPLKKFLTFWYNTGTRLSQKGISARGVNTLFLHARELAFYLQACDETDDDSEKITVPKAYLQLYDIVSMLIVQEELVLGLKKMSEKDLSSKLTNAEKKALRNLATEWPLVDDFIPPILLPKIPYVDSSSDFDIEENDRFSRRRESSFASGENLQSSVRAAEIALGKLKIQNTTRQGYDLAEAQKHLNRICNQGSNDEEFAPAWYFSGNTEYYARYYMTYLRSGELKEEHLYKNDCCAVTCSGEYDSSVFGLGSIELCCAGCNKKECSIVGDESAASVSTASTIDIPAKKDKASPEIVTIAP